MLASHRMGRAGALWAGGWGRIATPRPPAAHGVCCTWRGSQRGPWSRATVRLYIIRHADPDYPNNTITPEGHLEARALAGRLAAEGLTHLYSSPLGRALDTMRYTVALVGLAPVTEEWMRELSGWRIDHPPWGVLAAWNLPGEVIRAEEPYPTH